MKKGINLYAVPGRFTLGEAFGMIKKAGFDGVELNMESSPRDDGKLSLHKKCTDKEIAEIKTLASNNGLHITSMVTGLLWANPLTSTDKATREGGKEAIRIMLDYCHEFGADTVLVVPGAVNESTHYDIAYENALESLNDLKTHAEKTQVSIGIENVWNKFLLSPLEMRDFIDKINSPYVGSYFDIGNVLINSFPEQWIKILGKRIRKLHAKDFKLSVGNIQGFVNLLEGDVNWKNVVNEIKNIGYADYITAELGAYDHFPMRMLEDTAKALDDIINI